MVFKIFKKKKKKPYKFPPNIHFYKDGDVILKVYIDRDVWVDELKKIKVKYDPDGYMTFAPTGVSTFVSLRKKKRKHWGSNS